MGFFAGVFVGLLLDGITISDGTRDFLDLETGKGGVVMLSLGVSSVILFVVEDLFPDRLCCLDLPRLNSDTTASIELYYIIR